MVMMNIDVVTLMCLMLVRADDAARAAGVAEDGATARDATNADNDEPRHAVKGVAKTVATRVGNKCVTRWRLGGHGAAMGRRRVC